MEILASNVNKILKKYKYTLVMDKMHNEVELKKCEKVEKYFDRREYLTIKNNDGIVIGRVYNINSNGRSTSKNSSLSGIKMTESELDILLAFFKFFRIPNAKKIANEISKLTHIKLSGIDVDIIRNNVYKQEID